MCRAVNSLDVTRLMLVRLVMREAKQKLTIRIKQPHQSCFCRSRRNDLWIMQEGCTAGLGLSFLCAKCYPQRLGILRNYRWSSSLISLDHTRDEQQKRANIDKRNFS